MAKLTFRTTNNEAEYEALGMRLSIVKLLGATKVEVKVESQVVVNQVSGEYTAKCKKLKK